MPSFRRRRQQQQQQQQQQQLPFVQREDEDVSSGYNNWNALALQRSQFLSNILIFVVGLFVGHFHGQQSLSSFSQFLEKKGEDYSQADHELQNQFKNDKGDEGWTKIDVYYGSTKKQDEMHSGLWYAQAQQDEAVLALLKYPENGGYFVDLAANDATTLSNTYALERYHGWQGLCIEPNPMYWYNLTTIRPNCTKVAAAVGETHLQPVDFLFTAGDHGGLVGTQFDNGPRFRSKSVQLYTTTLEKIFERYNVPTIIDYMSLDVEGAEEFILGDFPFGRYTFKVMTIERVSETLQNKLENHGYEKLLRLSRWGETLWANTKYVAEMNVSALDYYHAKKQRARQQAMQDTQQDQ